MHLENGMIVLVMDKLYKFPIKELLLAQILLDSAIICLLVPILVQVKEAVFLENVFVIKDLKVIHAINLLEYDSFFLLFIFFF